MLIVECGYASVVFWGYPGAVCGHPNVVHGYPDMAPCGCLWMISIGYFGLAVLFVDSQVLFLDSQDNLGSVIFRHPSVVFRHPKLTLRVTSYPPNPPNQPPTHAFWHLTHVSSIFWISLIFWNPISVRWNRSNMLWYLNCGAPQAAAWDQLASQLCFYKHLCWSIHADSRQG